MRHCAILDIGSSKIVCMIVGSEPDGAIIVRGTGALDYSGYRLGSLPQRRELAETMAGAVHSAERAAGVKVRDVTVGVPAPFMKVASNLGQASVLSRNGRVASADVAELIDDSLDFDHPENCSLIHSTPVSFVADRTPITGSPIGLPCGVLSAEVSHCFVEDRYKDLVTGALAEYGISVDSFVSSALASACFTIPESIRADRVFLVDCGGTHTDITLLSGNAIVASDSIGIGGRHFTGDLCYCLRLPEGVAEDLKRRYVFSLDYGESCERVRIPGEGVFDVEHSFIQLIIEARAEELCDMLCAKLDLMAGEVGQTPVFLTGAGFALMRGAKEFIENRIGRKVAVSMPSVSKNSSLSFASAFGLADFALFRVGKSGPIKKTERYLRRAFDWRT